MYHVRTLASLSYYRYVFGLNYGIFTVFKPILAIRNFVLRGIYGCVPAWSYLFCGGVDSLYFLLPCRVRCPKGAKNGLLAAPSSKAVEGRQDTN